MSPVNKVIEVASKFLGQIAHQIASKGKKFISAMKLYIPDVNKQKKVLSIPHFSIRPKTTKRKVTLKSKFKKLVTMNTFFG